MMGSARETIKGWQHKILKKKLFLYAAAAVLLVVNITLIVIMYEHNGYIRFS